MRIIPKQFATFAGIAAMSTAGLFGAVSHAQRPTVGHDHFMSEVETILAMTPAQRAQTQAAMQSARQSAMPIRQELKSTNQALRTAVRSDNTAEIQRLTTTEGQEIGQLMAIRSSALAKVYKTLTPDQRERADALHGLLMRGIHRQMES